MINNADASDPCSLPRLPSAAGVVAGWLSLAVYVHRMDEEEGRTSSGWNGMRWLVLISSGAAGVAAAAVAAVNGELIPASYSEES